MKANKKITVYHFSHVLRRDSILKRGLLPKEHLGGILTYDPRIFITKKIDVHAFDYTTYENVDIWSFEVNESELIKDNVSDSKNHFYIERKVDIKDLRLYKSNTSISEMKDIL